MKGISFANVITVWKWWYKPIYMFFTIFLIKRALLKRFYIYLKLLQSSKIFVSRRDLRLKFLHGIFYNSQLKKCNCYSTHSCNRKIWVVIPSYVIFPCSKLLEILCTLYKSRIAFCLDFFWDSWWPVIEYLRSYY